MKSETSSNFNIAKATRWPLFLILNSAILILVGISAGRESYEQWKVDKEISGLKAEVQAMEGKRLDMFQALSRLDSPEALDREARLRLDVKKPGERVVILQGLDTQEPSTALFKNESTTGTRSNPMKWLYYFFMQE